MFRVLGWRWVGVGPTTNRMLRSLNLALLNPATVNLDCKKDVMGLKGDEAGGSPAEELEKERSSNRAPKTALKSLISSISRGVECCTDVLAPEASTPPRPPQRHRHVDRSAR
jgi:hypothetical protein